KEHDFVVLQMNRRRVEDRERESVSSMMMKAVDDTCSLLAKFLYETYVCELEKRLNEICTEQKDIFRTTLKQEECTIETRALIRRIARPMINATIRWPHDFEDCRIDAAKELARIAPLLAFKVCDNETQASKTDSTPILAKWLCASFQFCPINTPVTADVVPEPIKSILKILN
ncbi:unnamed protein product, partial [Didymodactylos carnosus]